MLAQVNSQPAACPARTSSPYTSIAERFRGVAVDVGPETRLRYKQGVTIQPALVIRDLKISLVLLHGAVFSDEREADKRQSNMLV